MTDNWIIVPLRRLLTKYDESYVMILLATYSDCMESDQEIFLTENAIMMERKNMCRTYLAFYYNRKILGYYSLGLRCMKVPDLACGQKEFHRRMNVDPESGVAQSYLIGQLSRSRDAPKGFGAKLMSNAINMIKEANTIVDCRTVRVDCKKDLIDYYSKYGFRLIRENNNKNLNQMAYILRA